MGEFVFFLVSIKRPRTVEEIAMKNTALIALALLVPTLVLQGGGEHGEKKAHVTKAVCVVLPKSGSKVRGVLTFTQKGKEVHIKGQISGLEPGKHGFHVHEFGDIRDAKGMSTGGHYDPEHSKHGKPEDDKRHVGDLGNITADDSGKAMIDITDSVISLNGPHSIVGRAIIVHAKEDVFTQPVGDAGGRVGAGVIGIADSKPKKANQ
jgi:Cu-Zn family superoxide dismutase